MQEVVEELQRERDLLMKQRELQHIMPNTLEIFSCGAHVLIYNNGKKNEVKRTMSEILAFCEENKIDVLIGDIKAYDKTRAEVEAERKAQQNQ